MRGITDERAEIESLRAERDALKARLAEAERVCPHCGSKLWQCYDARRYGAIACCPDCDHRATDSAPTAPLCPYCGMPNCGYADGECVAETVSEVQK